MWLELFQVLCGLMSYFRGLNGECFAYWKCMYNTSLHFL